MHTLDSAFGSGQFKDASQQQPNTTSNILTTPQHRLHLSVLYLASHTFDRGARHCWSLDTSFCDTTCRLQVSGPRSLRFWSSHLMNGVGGQSVFARGLPFCDQLPASVLQAASAQVKLDCCRVLVRVQADLLPTCTRWAKDRKSVELTGRWRIRSISPQISNTFTILNHHTELSSHLEHDLLHHY